MATDLIKSLRERQDALREELMEDSKFQEYDLVMQLLARHEAVGRPLRAERADEEVRDPPKIAGPARYGAPQTAPPRVHFQRTSTGMAAVIEASAEYLRRKGSRAGSAELHSELVKRRILHSGPDERAKVSSYLGRSKLFDNVRGEGYGLKEWAEAAT